VGANALIGYTGFVGSTLARARPFSHRFNSSNIEEIRGEKYSVVVCAGVSAVKWFANKEPEKDKAGIDRLVRCLDTIETDHLVLFSTIDVYPSPFNVTEQDVPDQARSQPYGKHRRELEIWAAKRFKRCTIVRLPGLFGDGLKKNLIYDLLNNNQVEAILPNGLLQWYPMKRLPSDLDLIIGSGLDLINVSPVPILTEDIRRKFFPNAVIGMADRAGPHYDMRTLHDGLLGGRDGYHIGRDDVFQELSDYIARMRK